MSARVVACRRLLFEGRLYLPGEHVPAEVWEKVPYSKRETLRAQGHIRETAFPLRAER
jgi:hypothetical protein